MLQETQTMGADLVITLRNTGHCLDTDHIVQYADSGEERSPQSQQSLIYFKYYEYLRRVALIDWQDIRNVRQVVTYERWDNTEPSALSIINSIDRELTIVLNLTQDWHKVLWIFLEIIVRWESTCVCVSIEGRIVSSMSTSNLDVSWWKVIYTQLRQERSERAVMHEEHRVQLDDNEKRHTLWQSVEAIDDARTCEHLQNSFCD